MTVKSVKLEAKKVEKNVDTDDFYDDATELPTENNLSELRNAYVIYMNEITEFQRV